MRPYRTLALLLFTSIAVPIFAQHEQRLAGAEFRSRKFWAKYMPAITAMGRKEWPNEKEGINASVLDYRYFSGLPTALIDLGCCGANTDEIYVIQIRNGKPFRPAFWSPKGLDRPEFSQGASSMHGLDVNFSTKNGIVSTYWENSSDGDILANCSQDTYVWSVKRKRFEWDRKLSYKREAPNCGTLENISN